MPGIVALCGGNEFEADSVAFNKAILQSAKGNKPQVVIVPAAFPENPRKPGRAGVGVMTALGARAESILVADRAMANDSQLAAPIETAQVIYLPDGNPLAVVETLWDTELLAHMSHRWQQGAILAASGAAAMALCSVYWDSGVWEPGLGLLKTIAILPHYEHIAGRFSPERLTQDLPAGITLLGLDDSTGIMLDGKEAKVAGSQTVTRYGLRSQPLAGSTESESATEAITEYENGETFPCELL